MIALCCALLWSLIGWPLARRCMPAEVPPIAVAPLLGWAVHTTLAATLLPWIGWSRASIVALILLLLAACWAAHRLWPPHPAAAPLRAWMVPLAALLACGPALAVLPKHTQAGVRLAGPIFDHSKIAIVDAIARSGLPALNPFYGGGEISPHLAYYYWWHLAAAEIARVTNAGGWTADAALTWFTAFATALLIGGLAASLGGSFAGGLGMALLIPGSMRPLVAPLERAGWLLPRSGLGGWLNQASWAPQHLAAAGCLLLAALLLASLAARAQAATVVVLAAVIAAAFGSSAWVGGVVAAIGLPVACVLLAASVPRPARARFVLYGATGGLGALILAAPLLHDEAAASVGREGLPVALAFYPVLGEAIPAAIRRLLSPFCLPILLLVESPALAVFATIGACMARADRWPPWHRAILAVGGAGLLVCWCARSTIENNDLGWRAILPALLSVAPLAAVTLMRLWSQRPTPARMALLAAPPLLGLSGAAPLLRENWAGHAASAAPSFARNDPDWQTLRRLSGATDRVINDPATTAGMTFWPANIAWALLADRPSCYSGWATAHPFTPIPDAALYRTELEVRRVFDGAPAAADVHDLAARLQCRFALLTWQSPGWAHDPFRTASDWRLVAAEPGRWRIYQAITPAR